MEKNMSTRSNISSANESCALSIMIGMFGLSRWKAKYGGMEVSEARRLRALEEENRQLKHAVAELLLDKRALQAVVAKKW